MKRNYTAYFGKDDSSAKTPMEIKDNKNFLYTNDAHGVGEELADKDNIQMDFDGKDYTRIALGLIQDLVRHLYSDTNLSKAEICGELIGRMQEIKDGGIDLDTVKKLSNKYGY